MGEFVAAALERMMEKTEIGRQLVNLECERCGHKYKLKRSVVEVYYYPKCGSGNTEITIPKNETS